MNLKLLGWLWPALTNNSQPVASQTVANDYELLIQDEVLRLSRRYLVAYQFGQPLRLDKQHGTQYTATRYERLPLPYAPLQEGVAASGEQITLTSVNAVAQQWGDLVRISDVADITYKHPLFKQARRLIAMQQPETIERNVLNTLLTATQVNYANQRANRASVLATDVLTPTEVYRIVGSLDTFGAPTFMGDEREDMFVDAAARKDVSKSPANMEHYVALIHTLPVQDFKLNATVANAWSESDINRLYNNDLGEWGGARFCKTNMMPYWVGNASPTNGTASASGGSLATNTYYIQITGSPAATSVEQQIYQVSAGVAVTGPNGSISVTLPTKAGYVFNVYIGTTTSPVNLALTASGPATGTLAGQATQLASGATVILTGVGTAQTPPAAPATGVTVFPTIFIGQDAYGQVLLEDVKYYYLDQADKSDPMNQTRVVSWTMFYGTIILNQAYLARVEHSSAFSTGYSAGTATE